MDNYHLQGNAYMIEEYDKLPAFSSFLPGVAGIKGIPLWVYYTNRGQGINSFGIHNKNNAIMEFNPANTAYENTNLKGFRTFIKSNHQYFEPFSTQDRDSKRSLQIKKNSIVIEEINEKQEIRTRIKYYVLPNESIGALVRSVEIENLSKDSKEIELLDGLPKIIPYGIHNNSYKEMSNLLKSWTEIKNIDQNIPYYTMRASSEDSAEVSDVEGGYYYLSVQEGKILPVIYDSELIFDYETSLANPVTFMEKCWKEMLDQEQCYYNKIPCGFTPISFTLTAGEHYKFNTMVGYSESLEQVNEKIEKICSDGYFEEKEILAEQVVEQLTSDIATHTAKPVFDQYMEQCYLDNFIRGGYPFIFNKDGNKSVVHLFSRKHGDPERDYNFFSIAGEYYSQGNGNFRDVNQNRRNDVFFQKDIGDFNIKTFFQLIQIDGYNPLEVRPSTFTVKKECGKEVSELLARNLGSEVDKIQKLINKSFTPGQIANTIVHYHIPVACGEDELLIQLLSYSNQNIEAGFGEGYWSDHWDYNMELIDNYLKIYPEKEKELLYGDASYRFYDSAARVLPRSEKYVINNKKQIRQYGSLLEDEEKAAQEGFLSKGTNWLKTKSGEIVTVNLMTKLISLALNKFSSLDSYGMGVEMEGGKPGWNDAMNGLPGLFGSGMAETFELKSLLEFIRDTIMEEKSIQLPEEIYQFLGKTADALAQSKKERWSDFAYWDIISGYREQYRESTRFSLTGVSKNINTEDVREIIMNFILKVEQGIAKACKIGAGIVPTYFTFEATEYEEIKNESGKPVISHYGLPKVVVKAFEVQYLPCFLEGPAKMLGVLKGKEAVELYDNVRKSELFDPLLKMYKTSVPIEHLSMENGRIRAFTPGWLERESIFLHMSYKYLYAILKAGLYEKFYEEFPNALIAFRNPKQYGRSILENSSFLASSSNPNSKIHGRGFVARLSGSTTEVLSMWIMMFMGHEIFTYEQEQLQLRFNPILPGWMFDEYGEASFTLLSKCRVTYYNPGRKSTFGDGAAKIRSITIGPAKTEVLGDSLTGELAEAVRNNEINEINIYME
ncbi:MAG: hypothetical protein WBI07_13295 [Mobilitalea sp.]